MTSSGHALEIMQRLPGKLLCREFLQWFNILILILIVLCVDFVLFLVTFREKHDFEKRTA